jgi:hypothetical protein
MPRINESVIGDDWKSTVKQNDLVTRESIDYASQDGISSDTPVGNLSTSVDESGGIAGESPTPPPDIQPSNNPDVDSILNTMKKKGYKILTRPYEMNIVGIRRQYEGQKYSNQFRDDLCVIYKVDASEKWVIRKYNISTMPGFYYGKNSGSDFIRNKSGQGQYRYQPGTINVKQSNKMQKRGGVGIMMEAQYIGAYELGTYQNKPALRNVGRLKFYRDKSDSEFIKYTSDDGRGVTGMHLHLGFPGGSSVDNWSEGCQVFASEKQLNEFASLCREHVNRYGNRFNYTLLLDRDVN